MPARENVPECPHCAAAQAEAAAMPSHRAQLNALARIEGQVRGIRRMIEEGRYCVDILVQAQAVHAALRRVERKVLERHLETCVLAAFQSDDPAERERKIAEILALAGHEGRLGARRS
jgi:DNA-binding FrmR family transcriptional regulator